MEITTPERAMLQPVVPCDASGTEKGTDANPLSVKVTSAARWCWHGVRTFTRKLITWSLLAKCADGVYVLDSLYDEPCRMSDCLRYDWRGQEGWGQPGKWTAIEGINA